MRQRFDLVVFDWDGTLMDSEAKIVRSFELACADVGVPFPGRAIARSVIGLGLREAIEKLLPDQPGTVHDGIGDRYRVRFLDDETEMLFFPGVLEGLRRLEKHGYLLAVATGKSRRGLGRLLDEWSLHAQFVATRCADEAFSKPHPKMLEDILDATGVHARRALMIGDTTYDLEMAKNAGVASLGVTYGVHERDTLMQYDPLDCLETFDAVRSLLMAE